MAFSVKLSQKTQTGGVNPVVATRSLLDDISSSASTISFDKTVSMSGNVTIGDGDSDSLLIVGGDIQTRNALQWTCKDNDLTSLRIGSSTVTDLINIDTLSIPNKVTIKNLEVMNNLTKIETTNLTIKDPLIKLGNGNTSDSYDLGFYCQYKRTSENTKYAGLFRRGNNDGKFRLFTDLTTEPETTSVGSGYTAATLVVGSLEGNVTGNITGTVSDISNHNTDVLTEGTTNLYHTDSRSRSSISVTDSGGDGSLAYNNTSGLITYTGPSAAETRAHFSGGTGVSITNGIVGIGQSVGTGDDVEFNKVTSNLIGDVTGDITGQVNDISNHDTDALAEGTTNLYHTNSRSRSAISVTDSGGDGSLAYNNTSGVITYTGPSAAETRAHFSGGTGVSITNGIVGIGQSVSTNDNVSFNQVTSNLIGNVTGDVTGDITGNATTATTTDTINTFTGSGDPGTAPASGTISFNTSTSKLYIFNGDTSSWIAIN